MKVSALISSFWIDDEKPNILKKCLDSLEGVDEILSLVTHPKSPVGFSLSWNRLSLLATGDYIIFIGDNNIMTKGNLKDMCIPNTVTSALSNNNDCGFNGTVFCLPRNIFETIGLYDLRFNDGSHWEDIDLWRRLKESNIPMETITTINFDRPMGGRTIDKIDNHLQRKIRNNHLYKIKWGDELRP